MQIKNFIGIDVSKNTLDITMIDSQGKVLYYCQIGNTKGEIAKAISLIIKKHKLSYSEAVFCMEYTGIYNAYLLEYLQRKQALIWLESGTQISKSLGLVRGKNDKIDSYRISIYALTNRHKIKIWKAPRKVLGQLMRLLAQRIRYVKVKKQLTVSLNEQGSFIKDSILEKLNKKPVEAIEKAIILLESEILKLVRSDENLDRLYRIITSVDGVGMITAVTIISTTNEFLSINEVKKYACYSGVVPFEHRSGSSVRGKTRVSHMANKKVKTLLHLAALAAIKKNEEIRSFYERKIKEGKNKMSVINAIRNKILMRVFACVKENRLFEKKYEYCLVKP